jgi:hypothetical protein
MSFAPFSACFPAGADLSKSDDTGVDKDPDPNVSMAHGRKDFPWSGSLWKEADCDKVLKTPRNTMSSGNVRRGSK